MSLMAGPLVRHPSDHPPGSCRFCRRQDDTVTYNIGR